jgi:hypothetical protein
MNPWRSRTTISINEGLFNAGRQRATALGYKSFSEYIAYLIEEDLRERGQHVTIREERGQAVKKRSSG